VDLGGLADGVFESELFGHNKGAFTDAKTDRVGRFELADGSTLFLDEVANLSLSQQAKLLRVLQTGEFERVGSSKTRRVDVRILAATNADLRAAVAAGRFREDLFFRLNTVEIHLPPLRERRDDIPELAAYFLRQFAARYNRPVATIGADAMRALLAYAWPGNVRELAHAIERATLLAEGGALSASDLSFRAAGESVARLDDMSLEDVERVLITKALARFEGNVTAAADALGLSRSALYRRLQRHGL
jgi:DNA-binding NtrC family response regulator